MILSKAAERVYANIQRWTVTEKGGHFAALEQPEALARGDPRVLQAVAVEAARPTRLMIMKVLGGPGQ